MNIKLKATMNKKLLLTLVGCVLLLTLMAQKQDSTVYPVVVQFQSFCCGVPDDKPLKEFICTFKKQHKIKKITAWHIGPMGREGEYWLAFPLTEMNAQQADLFKQQVKAIAATLKDKGGAVVEENLIVNPADLSRGASFEKTRY